MARKKWEIRNSNDHSIGRDREKKKWQIALRRYVLEKIPSASYAPYFGLDIDNLRKWFENQFQATQGWDEYGQTWQFDHVVPLFFFDLSIEGDLRLCWHFTNLRLANLSVDGRSVHLDLATARHYFQSLHSATHYKPCLAMLSRIAEIEVSRRFSLEQHQAFILQRQSYLEEIGDFGSHEFGLLNKGYSPREARQEADFLKKYGDQG